MRALFLNPPFKVEHGRFSRESRSPAITKSGTNYYPIWLAYAAGTTEQAGHEVLLLDSCADRINRQDTLARIAGFNPDISVLDTSTPSIINDIEVGAAIKAQYPTSFVILMGTHPSALPNETLLMNPAIDAIARGEADLTVREVAEKLSKIQFQKLNTLQRIEILKTIQGLSFQVEGKIEHNPARPQIQDLDTIPFASQVYKKHLNIKNYFFAACDYPEIQIMSARGCTDRCTFCVYPHTMHELKYRVRSAKNLADEFEWIEKNMPEVKEVGIEDDTFAGHIKRVHEFCEEIIGRGIKLKWYTNVRATLKLETLKLMKKANCILLTAGYESANQEVLDKMKKRLPAQAIIDFSKNTKKAGIMVHSCFMVGNPGDTRATLQESLDLALKLNDDTMQFFPLIVYPGTPDYEWAKTHNLMTVSHYDEWVTPDGLHNSVIRMPDMDSREIVNWCDHARRKYYLRPRYLAYKAFQTIFKPSEMVRNLKAGKRFIHFLKNGSFGKRKNISPPVQSKHSSVSKSLPFPTDAPTPGLVLPDFKKMERQAS
ncbi:MAG TPA: B12-binding domain-containing radical SAM protein [Deltaproteobacteria bacterium]|nr:B12-binding domain-containing radical SAM protein [Deltaproteobacteria bacterium]